MRILTLTSLFPGSAQPRHGTFVRERLADYRDRYGARIDVVAPVPFWPRFLPSERYGAFARTPRRERYGSFDIEHPRYLAIPKFGTRLQGVLYEYGVRPTVRRLHREHRYDVLDAHYAYPDGFAAALLKRRLRLPLVLTVRGTDVNLLPKEPGLGDQIRFALASADRVIAVASALRDLAIEAGADPARTIVLRNGVDCVKFAPRDRDVCREELGIPKDRKVVASVGFLVPRKGHALLLDALARIEPEDRPLLVVAGDGPEGPALARRAADLGLDGDVRFLGAVEHADVPRVFSAADLSVLASDREGWPNVLLESMACGTPVVATAVHGVPEVVRDPAVGVLVTERSPQALSIALTEALAARRDRSAVRRYAEAHDWSETSAGLHRVFTEVTAR